LTRLPQTCPQNTPFRPFFTTCHHTAPPLHVQSQKPQRFS
jgi:hypothetical protein